MSATRRPSVALCVSTFAVFGTSPLSSTSTRTVSPWATGLSGSSGRMSLKRVAETLSKFPPGISARRKSVPKRFWLTITSPPTIATITAATIA